MAPEFIERFRGNRQPELSPQAIGFIEQHYNDLIDESGADNPVRQAGIEKAYSVLGNEHVEAHDINILLAAYFAWEIKETLADKTHDDLTNVGKAHIEKTDRLDEVFAVGVKLQKWVKEHGVLSIDEADRPFSSKIVAYLTAYAIKTSFELETDRDIKEFRWLLKIPLAFRRYRGNQI